MRGWRFLILLAAMALVACASSSTKINPPVVNVSIGQQLIDLKKAREAGAMSQQEYEKQARRLIDSVQ